MAVQYFAKVTAADHETFQKTVKHYPLSSYGDWCLKEQARMAEWKARRHSVLWVKVTPAEFQAFCEKTGATPDIITFRSFLERKA
jgi:hypothetical protein